MKAKQYVPSLLRKAQLLRISADTLNRPTENDVPIIVSCKGIASRFHVVDKTVRSVLDQTRPPRKMVLWLHERHQGATPSTLRELEGEKFEIRYTDLDSPHGKLVPTLKAFPDATLVTCDDDLMYRRKWLASLYTSHQAHPGDIVAQIGRLLAYDNDGEVKPYAQWPVEKRPGFSDPRLVPIGYRGVLYPPGSLHADATDTDICLQLVPRADDLWFKAMACLNGTRTRLADKLVAPHPLPRSQRDNLNQSNVTQDGNRRQWQAIQRHYNLRI